MRIIITGSSGMLGKELCQTLPKEWEVVGIHRRVVHQCPRLRREASTSAPVTSHELICDITDPSIIDNIIRLKPDVIIHTAAKTDVDGCELEPDEAYKINVQGTKNIALAAKKSKATIIYLSTDYVFDGEKGSPYIESDKPNPINVYGRTKLEGEIEVTNIAPSSFFIIRTAYLFGEGRANFVSHIVDSARTKKTINVWQDQIGSPTYAKDLAGAIYKIVQGAQSGIYHITNTGSCSRYEFAKNVLEYLKIDDIILHPLRFSDDNRPARRPLVSALDNSKYRDAFGQMLRTWDAALKEYLNANYGNIKKETP